MRPKPGAIACLEKMSATFEDPEQKERQVSNNMMVVPFPAVPVPLNYGEIVDTVAGLVADSTGVVVMHAAEALGCEMGDENIKVLPEEILTALTQKLGTEVSLVPEEMAVTVTGAGKVSGEGQLVPVPKRVSRYAEIGGERHNYHVVGNLAKWVCFPELWNLKPLDCVEHSDQGSRMKIQVCDFHPWESVVPLLALFIKPRATKRSRETTEETRGRQLKKFKTLFDATQDASSSSDPNSERAFGHKIVERVIDRLRKKNLFVNNNGICERGMETLYGTLDFDKIVEATVQIAAHVRPKKRSQFGSYGAKHICEKLIGYMTNGEFIVAMACEGHMPSEISGPNATYKNLKWIS